MNRFSHARWRRSVGALAVIGLVSITSAARAEETAAPERQPDTAAAFIAGASVIVAGLGVGASLIGSNGGSGGKCVSGGACTKSLDNAGWMVMQSSFAAAPIVAHGITGEWGRGLLFSSVPLATTAGSATVLAIDPNAVRHSPLPEQRILWSLFVVGLFSSAYGVVDALSADERARHLVVTPVVGRGIAGIDVEGTL
jgi:hypothetical protein